MDKEDLFISIFTQRITTEYLSRVSMILCQKKHIRDAGFITKYLRAGLSVYCDIIYHSLMNRTQRSSGGMPKVRERKSMMKRTMRH